MSSIAHGRKVSRGLFWTIVGAIAGVIGAGVAIYPLLMPAKERAARVEFCCDTSFHVLEDGEVLRQGKLSSNIGLLVAHAFSDAVIFTGNIKIKNLRLEPDIFHERNGTVSFDASGLKSEAIPPTRSCDSSS